MLYATDAEIFFQFIDYQPHPILILDKNQAITYANHAAQKMWDTLQIGDSLSRYIRSIELREAVDHLLFERDPAKKQEIEIILRQPVERSLLVTVTSLYHGNHHWVGLYIVDQTEQKKTVKMHADFVANVSHELRTPLASICGFIETLQTAAKGDQAAQEKFLDIMAQQAKRMQKLIDSLLSLTRIELNKHIQPVDKIDILPVLERVGLALKPLAAAKNIHILSLMNEKNIYVSGSPDELEQVFQNIIENAIKYSPKDTSIYIKYTRDRIQGAIGFHGISIQDEGHGIAEEHIPRLTERFFRVDEARNRSQGGAGLGLSIVNQIIRRHKGELVINSTLQKGSVFTVYLPVYIEP